MGEEPFPARPPCIGVLRPLSRHRSARRPQRGVEGLVLVRGRCDWQVPWDQLPPAVIAEVHRAFPRDGFADGMADLLEAAVGRSPAAYALTWLAETANRCCGASLPTFDSFLRRDPFATVAASSAP